MASLANAPRWRPVCRRCCLERDHRGGVDLHLGAVLAARHGLRQEGVLNLRGRRLGNGCRVELVVSPHSGRGSCGLDDAFGLACLVGVDNSRAPILAQPRSQRAFGHLAFRCHVGNRHVAFENVIDSFGHGSGPEFVPFHFSFGDGHRLLCFRFDVHFRFPQGFVLQ